MQYLNLGNAPPRNLKLNLYYRIDTLICKVGENRFYFVSSKAMPRKKSYKRKVVKKIKLIP